MAATARVLEAPNHNLANDQLPRAMSETSRQLWDGISFYSVIPAFGSADTFRSDDTPIAMDTVNVIESISRQAIKPTLDRVRSLASWPEGWNGYDALSPDGEAIDHAMDWLVQLYIAARDTGSRWIAPNVTASPDGDVVLEWWEGTKKLTVYVSGEHAEYVASWGPDIESEMRDGTANSFDACRTLWAWLMRR